MEQQFDPSKPFKVISEEPAQAPQFDPSKPFTEVKGNESGFDWMEIPGAIGKTIYEMLAVPVEGAIGAGKAMPALADWLWKATQHPGDALSDVGRIAGNVAEAALPVNRTDLPVTERVIPGWHIANSIARNSAYQVLAGNAPRGAAELFWVLEGLRGLNPAAIARTPSGGVRVNLSAISPEHRKAMDYLRQQGVSVPVDVATNNKALGFLREGAEGSTVSGSINRNYATAESANALRGVQDRLRASTGGTAERLLDAGNAVLGGISNKITALKTKTKQFYDQWDQQVDALPETPMRVGTKTVTTPTSTVLDATGNPVSSGGLTQVPIIKNMRGGLDMTPLQQPLENTLFKLRSASRAGVDPAGPVGSAIRTLSDMLEQMPEGVSIKDAEAARGELLAIKRRIDKSVDAKAYAAITNIEQELNSVILKRAHELDSLNGTNLAPSLQKARAARAARAEVDDALVEIAGKKPNGAQLAAKLLAAPDDVKLPLLQKIAEHAPDTLDELGSALMQSMWNMARENETAVARADRIYQRWHKIGNETKRLIFKNAIADNPNYLADVDAVVYGMKNIAKVMNPSGSGNMLMSNLSHGAGTITGAVLGGAGGGDFATALLGMAAAEAGGLMTSKILRSPKLVSLLAGQLKNPVTATTSAAVRAARSSAVAKAFQEVAQGQSFAPSLSPAFAQRSPEGQR